MGRRKILKNEAEKAELLAKKKERKTRKITEAGSVETPSPSLPESGGGEPLQMDLPGTGGPVEALEIIGAPSGPVLPSLPVEEESPDAGGQYKEPEGVPAPSSTLVPLSFKGWGEKIVPFASTIRTAICSECPATAEEDAALAVALDDYLTTLEIQCTPGKKLGFETLKYYWKAVWRRFFPEKKEVEG